MSDFDPHEERPEEPNLDQLTRDADLKWLVADPRGQRIARWLLAASGVWRSSFTGDALTTAFREGERNAGLRLMSSIGRAAPEALADILRGATDG